MLTGTQIAMRNHGASHGTRIKKKQVGMCQRYQLVRPFAEGGQSAGDPAHVELADTIRAVVLRTLSAGLTGLKLGSS